jgi:hypothetical protein
MHVLSRRAFTRFIVPGAGHQMWLRKGDVCRAQTAAFLKRVGA